MESAKALEVDRQEDGYILVMYNTKFSPFSKHLDAVIGDDLIVLREVDEGWFVDYKSQAIKPVEFGKVLSSFANQFGGWVFVGVEEGPNKSLRAAAFPGIPTADVPQIMVAIREGVAAHVSTPVFFQHKIIDGPVASIGLPDRQSIIILNVSEGENPPYVHSSGRIYRRIADSSEPKVETDRSVLDEMWKRSERITARLKEWILDPTEGDPLDGVPVGYLYLLSDRSHSNYDSGLTFQKFREVITKPGAMLRLDHVFHTQDGYMARHLMNNNPSGELASLRWFFNGNVRITVPMNVLGHSTCPPEPIHDELTQMLREQKYERYRVLDMGLWGLVLKELIRQYFQLQEHIGVFGGMVAKVVLKNVWGCIPYLPMQALKAQLNTGGVPVSADGFVMVPQGFTPDSFINLEKKIETPPDSLDDRCRLMAIQLVVRTLRSLGLGFDEVNLEDETIEMLIVDYLKAMNITMQRFGIFEI